MLTAEIFSANQWKYQVYRGVSEVTVLYTTGEVLQILIIMITIISNFITMAVELGFHRTQMDTVI